MWWGRYLKPWKKRGVAENTLVIFSSDNGPVWFDEDVREYGHRSVGPWRGMKNDAYEGGHRMPFVARWPGKIEPGSTSSQMLCFTDMLATFADLVGDTLPEAATTDSFSALPALLGQPNARQREGVIVENRTVREGQWKLIFGNGMGGLHRKFGKKDPAPVEGELYDLAADPGEQNNLYQTRPDKVAALDARMEEYKAQGVAAE